MKNVLDWVIQQVMVAFIVAVIIAFLAGLTVGLLSGCTPHHAHRIWDGYEITNGWATSQETTR